MRNFITGIFIVAFSGLSAQLPPLTPVVSPLDQAVRDLLIPNLIPHDSIVVSQDTGQAFSPMYYSTQHVYTHGHLKSLNIAEIGNQAAAYHSTESGRSVTLSGENLRSTGPDSLDQLTYRWDANGRDSTLTYRLYNPGSSSFEEAFTLSYHYFTGTKMFRLRIGVPGMGIVGDWTFYYDSEDRVDSLFYDVFSLVEDGPGYYTFEYHPILKDRLVGMKRYYDPLAQSDYNLVEQVDMVNNGQNQVIESIHYTWNDTTQSLELAYAVRYGVHANSSLAGEELEKRPAPVLYPNPVQDILCLEHVPEATEYRVFHLAGKLALTGRIKSTAEIDMSTLPAGIYFLALEGDDKTHRVIKR